MLIEKTIYIPRSEFDHYSELVRLGVPDYNEPEWVVLATHKLADIETLMGPDISILFHVYNAPECICFEFECVFSSSNTEVNSSPIYYSLSDSWSVAIDQKEYKFAVNVGN